MSEGRQGSRSVGWLICDTQEVKALAPNLADADDRDHIQASGVIRIRTRAVQRVPPLTEEARPISLCEWSET
jgi:hypothetical protein